MFRSFRKYQKAIWAGCAAFWSGVALSGNLVAAPAKFQVSALELPLALQVGRAQFLWIGWVEWAVLTLIVISWLARPGRLPWLLTIAAGIFLLQQLWLQPLLRVRSDQIIAGQGTNDSIHHIIFASLEVAKCAALIIFSIIALMRICAVKERLSKSV